MTTTATLLGTGGHAERALDDAWPTERNLAAGTSVQGQRARSADADPSPSNRQLVERLESLHRAIVERSPRDAGQGDGAVDEGVTLRLHGDLNGDSVPHLQAVLHALVLLQPGRLTVDFSDVGRVSREILRLIERCGTEIGRLSLCTPSSSARADLLRLGCVEFVDAEGELASPASPEVRPRQTIESEAGWTH